MSDVLTKQDFIDAYKFLKEEPRVSFAPISEDAFISLTILAAEIERIEKEANNG